MGIFRRAKRDRSPARFKILIIAADGEVLYWRKRGDLHIVDEDVARRFVSSFNPKLFEVTDEGTLEPPAPERTRPILRVEMVRVRGEAARPSQEIDRASP